MAQDPEIKAMAEVAAALSGLEPEGITRVLRWASDRFQVRVSAPSDPSGKDEEGSASGSGQYADFASLFDAANPQSGVENALVAGYWFQHIQGEADFDSQTLNTEMKHLGRPSTNITRDLDGLINRTPRLVLQVRKSGSTKQARKRYKLTTEGERVVERMLSGGSFNTD